MPKSKKAAKKAEPLVKINVADAFAALAIALTDLTSHVRQLGDVITLRERLAEQTSHVRRLLRDKELLQEALDEANTDVNTSYEQPKDWPEDCPHTSFCNIRDDDGIAIYQCLECGEEFDHG